MENSPFHKLPIRKQPFPEAECLPFFSGLLPDGQIRIQIADAKHISYMSVFKLLQNYGGEVAGTILCQEEQSKNAESSYKDILEKELLISTTPIMLRATTSRASLAGFLTAPFIRERMDRLTHSA